MVWNAKSGWLRFVLVPLSFLLMLGMNVAANALPLFGVTTSDISARYPSLITPAPYTFMIWSVIYVLLALYVLFQIGFWKGGETDEALLQQMGLYFVMANLFQVLWLIAWHGDLILVAAALLLLIVFTVGQIVELVRKKAPLTARERLFLQLPFSVYFAWVNVAAVCNISVYLVKIDFEFWGISPTILTVVTLCITLLLALFIVLRNRDVWAGLTFLWAFGGIFYMHYVVYDAAYVPVPVACVFALLATLAASVFAFRLGQRARD